MAADLTAADYAYLIILMAEGRELSNTELHKLYEVRLISPDYERLNGAGYVLSDTTRRPYRHLITETGIKALSQPLTIEQGRVMEGGRRTSAERQLFWAAMVAQQKLMGQPSLQGSRAAATTERPGDVDGRIRSAYAKLAGGPGKWVNLTALRPLLADVPRPELDKALVKMLDAPDVRLEPEPFGHRVGAEERDAAVHIGGEDRHKLAIGLR